MLPLKSACKASSDKKSGSSAAIDVASGVSAIFSAFCSIKPLKTDNCSADLFGSYDNP